MKRQLPPLNALRAFEAAARLQSFSAAADVLHVTHGAISRQIRQLEDWLGKPLFERLNRRVLLTAAGASYLAEITPAFERIEAATARQLAQREARLLRVNAPATFTLRWLIPRLSLFQIAHPQVEVRISTSNDPIPSLGDAYDVIIRGGPQTLKGHTGHEFMTEDRLPVCSPALLARQPLETVGDLQHHTLLHTATLPDVWRDWLDAAGAPALQPAQSLTLEHFYLTLQAALDGLGVAMGPTLLVADDVAEGRLVLPFDGPRLNSWRYFAYVPDKSGNDAAVQAFCDWLYHAARAATPD
ncbi:Glycine cleavage system transcriptional activator [Andreprevotia sp. IGB-42]|uniref:transcriptional regulator GcvA n=1 Tax=Andreprevotia sp. IGB-42 TaxID=2497473 RepID=UPI00135BA56E|nr:transcriptional regulator GcvA [Andreprevotia sp. IGB-42]KAF0813640.1 Glycine cleavage system transcriptional activator [Andreprevotia sp. IGB-42]